MNYYVLLLFFITTLFAQENIPMIAALQTAHQLIEQEKYHEALPYFEQALIANPTDVQLIFEYANTLNTVNQFQKSLSLYQQLLQNRPHDCSILYNIAHTLKKLGRITEALPYYYKTLQQKPDYAEAHFSLGLAYLMTGNFKQGWPEYEWRWHRHGSQPRTFSKPRWDGSSLDGKIIFLHAEQGLGDTFQFIRYAKIIKEKYKVIIVVAVQHPLLDIISKCCPYIDKVITLDQMPVQFDFHAPLLSLPLIMETEENTIPTPTTYITPDSTLNDYWKDKLAADPHIKVGICWQGNSHYSTPYLRAVVAAKSIPLAAFAQLTTLPGISWYSLQKETGTEQIATLTTPVNIHYFDDQFDQKHGRFMDTAAVINNLDLVITVDTSIAHLAGALGKQTWLLLPEPADWRWMLHRLDSPWYPHTMRLFRQPTAGDWQSVIQQVTIALQHLIKDAKNEHTIITSPAPSVSSDPSSFEIKLQHNPDDALTHYAYAVSLAQLDQVIYYPKAYYHFKRALELQPLNLDWLFNYGTFCCRIGKFNEALNAYRTMLIQKPSAIPALYNSGYVFKLAGEFDTAIAIYKKILTLQPQHEPAHLALAFALLQKGNFAEGWKEHTWNLRHQGKNSDVLRHLLKNTAIAGKTIVVIAEGGLGDTIQFVRYAQRLYNLGAHVIVAAQQPLLSLLAGCPFIDQLIPSNGPLPRCDATATLMSLPVIFADTPADFAPTIPYIFPPKERTTYWQEHLKSNPNVKIGICWQPDIHNDVSRLPIARRGIPLAHFFTIGSLPGITLYSLQQHEGLDQLKEVPSSVNLVLFDDHFDQDHGRFIDTAAVIANLDLIITTDTAVAHLAGAMGKRTWLLLPYATDWRWIHGRTDSPWYPTMRIFKQPAPFDWHSVIREVEDILCKEILPH